MVCRVERLAEPYPDLVLVVRDRCQGGSDLLDVELLLKSRSRPLSLLSGTTDSTGELHFAVTGFDDTTLIGEHAESGDYTLTVQVFFPVPSLPSWAVLFVISGLLAAIGWGVRKRMSASPKTMRARIWDRFSCIRCSNVIRRWRKTIPQSPNFTVRPLSAPSIACYHRSRVTSLTSFFRGSTSR